MKYTLEQRVFMLEKYIKYKSFQEFCVAFVQKYPDVKLPRKSAVRRLVAKFRETGSLLDETEEVDQGRSKGLVRNKLQTIRKTSRPLTTQRKSNGRVARERDISVSGSDTETQTDVVPFTFIGIKREVEEEMDGDRGSGSDVQVRCDEARLATVKTEPRDRSSSESSNGESRQEPFTCVNIKQEVEDDAYVIGMQSDLGGGKSDHTEALQVLKATSGCETQESEGMQQQDMFASVKVEGEEEAK